MLTQLNLKTVYDSSEGDIVTDLITPLLKKSIRYDRGVGFFSSNWLRLASKGLVDFAENAGFARLIMSPMISEVDWNAIQKGDEAKKDAILYKALSDSIKDLKQELEEDPLNALAWLIADGLIAIKFAIPKGRLDGGDFHDKFAIFEDSEGNKVAIHGSFNDTMHASLNGESFSVFKSWDVSQNDYVVAHYKRFISLWENKNEMFEIYDIPGAIKQEIIRLRSRERPYSCSCLSPNAITSDSIISQQTSNVVLRDYQEEAIRNWKAANFCGIFEMATGTGKTITSIACANEIFSQFKQIALIVFVPYIHLVEQWERELGKFAFFPVMCSSEHGNWQQNLNLRIQDFNLGFRKILCCITTHQTAATENFQEVIKKIKVEPKLGIYDEVHSLGAPLLRKALSESIKYRIGLSATPQRWYDKNGTKVLMNYFKSTCFSFPLEKAIGKFLVPYEYMPHKVELTSEEFYEYIELTKTINRVFNHDEEISENTYLQSLLRARSNLITNASNKILILRELLDSELEKCRESRIDFSHALFYCPPGNHRAVLDLVADCKVKAHEFIAYINSEERQRILNSFAKGELQALIAMRCLDEGVDIPATKLAFILASTTNPRQFIQRRGRILRKSEGKEKACIHDFIVIPPLSEESSKNIDYKKNILKREMPRFAEFASLAENEFEARSKFKDVLDKFYVSYLFDMKPWEIYAENISARINDLEED